MRETETDSGEQRLHVRSPGQGTCPLGFQQAHSPFLQSKDLKGDITSSALPSRILV